MRIIKTLSEAEYASVQVLRAIGEEKRFIILKNLRQGECYAQGLAKALKISRPALEKHARRLIRVNLMEKRILLEEGRAKSIFNLTELGEKVLGIIDGVASEITEYESRFADEFRNRLIEVSTQINSLKATIKKLSKQYREKKIKEKVYINIKADYENQLSALIAEASKIRKKLSNM